MKHASTGKFEHWIVWGEWLLLGVTLILMALSRYWANIDQDELEALHTGWKLLNDGVIFRDFFQHHHPMVYYLLAGLIKIFGQTLQTLHIARFLTFINYCICGALSYLIAKRIFSKEAALISLYLFFLSPIFMKILEVRPDGLQTFFALAAIYYLFLFFDSHKLWHVIFSAFLMGLAFLCLQKIIAFIFLVGCVLLYGVYHKQYSIKIPIIYGITGIVTVLPYYIYLYENGSLEYYLKFNWLINILHPERFHPVHTLQLLLSGSQFLCVFFVLGLFYFIKTYQQKLVAFFSLGLLFWAIFVVKFSFSQYYVPAIPFMAMIAGNAMIEVLDQDRKKIFIVLLVFASSSVLGSVFTITKALVKGIHHERVEKIQYVLDVTKPDDYVYDGKSWFNLFRPDIDFFWYEVRVNQEKSVLIPLYERLTGKKYDIYKAIERYKPRIISDYYLDMTHPVIAQHYCKSDQFDDLWIRRARFL